MTCEQFGFRKKSSTSMAIANLHEYILKELDCNLKVRSAFIDLAKVFGTVNHDILLCKLEQYGIDESANNLICFV